MAALRLADYTFVAMITVTLSGVVIRERTHIKFLDGM
jgi:hypothetical protein